MRKPRVKVRATVETRPALKPSATEGANRVSGRAGSPPSAYTVRLSGETQRRFEWLRRGRKLRDIGEEAIALWMRAEERNASGLAREADASAELEDTLRENLVTAVTEHLRSNSAWAESAIRAASLMDPVTSVFFRRVSHFHSEKQTLSKAFVPWLVRRIVFHLQQGIGVRLAVESGTTLKVVLDHLGPCLQGRSDIAEVWPERLQIITNNFPGAESYEAYARGVELSGRKLSDVVPCELVPGRALQEYAAVVGVKAEAYLREYLSGDHLSRIGLVVGNWVLLEGNPARPVPLARGAGHKSFKEEVLKNSSEVYLISPLCKIIRADRRRTADENVAMFNENLKKVAPSGDDGKGDYSRIDLDALGVDPGKIKLVTTCREKSTSIVKVHSKLVLDALGIVPRPTYDSDAERSIHDVEHLAFPHDAHADASFDDQLKVELPHKRTRADWFRRQYFDVES